MQGADSIRRSIFLPASLEDVWSALTEQERLTQWLAPLVKIDLRPGGKLLLSWDGFQMISARFAAVDPPRPLRLYWQAHIALPGPLVYQGLQTQVDITLKPVFGGTELFLIESGFDKLPDDLRVLTIKGSESGWDEELSDLEAHVGVVRQADLR